MFIFLKVYLTYDIWTIVFFPPQANYGAKLKCIYFVSIYNPWNDFIPLVHFLVITEYILKKKIDSDHKSQKELFIYYVLVLASTDIITFSNTSQCLSGKIFDLLVLPSWIVLLGYLICVS